MSGEGGLLNFLLQKYHSRDIGSKQSNAGVLRVSKWTSLIGEDMKLRLLTFDTLNMLRQR